jgi:hypothetical protein
MNRAALLQDLRQRTGSNEISKKDLLPAPNFHSGVAVGIVAELMGTARVDWLIDFFKMNPEKLILWCKSASQPNPQALYQRGIALERIKFVNTTGSDQQVIRIALESQLYPFIIAPNHFEEVRDFQRMHLLAEKSKSIVFLLAQKKFSQAWPISLQLEINSHENSFDIFVHKQKHGFNE